MAGTEQLIVPIRLEALLVGGGESATNFAPATANFAAMATSKLYLSQSAMRQPFDVGAMPKGIHLHLNLPHALRKGDTSKSGEFTMPAAPNRWLLTRIVTDLTDPANPALTYQNVVIQSDALGTNSPTTVPTDPSTGTVYTTLGAALAYPDGLTNVPTQSMANLTAMGYGTPDFASFYPNCQNVFGYLDSTLNSSFSAECSLGYIVVGWYADPDSDPAVQQQLSGSQNPLGWLFSGAAPASSLYCGALFNIPWDPASGKAYFADWQDDLVLDLAIGNSPVEALSALIAAGQPKASATAKAGAVEMVMNALQYGLLKEMEEPGGLHRIQSGIMQQSFFMDEAGLVWDVKPQPGAKAELSSLEYTPAMGKTLAEQISQLNTLQREFDEQTAILNSLRNQLFADWTTFMVVEHSLSGSSSPGSGTTLPDYQNLKNYLSASAAVIAGMSSAHGQPATLQQQIQTLSTTIIDSLPEGLELVSAPLERAHSPNELTFLMAGENVASPPPDNAATIACVTSSNLLSSVHLPAGIVSGSQAFSLSISSLPAIASSSALPAGIASLIQSSILASPQNAAVVASTLAQQSGSSNPAVLDFDATVSAIAAAQTAFLTGTAASNGITFTGSFPQPDIAMRPWTMPWNPVSLSWNLNYFSLAACPSNSDYPDTLIVDNYTFDPETETYTLKPTSQVFSSNIQTYSGSVLLSGGAASNITSQLRQYLQHISDPAMQAVLEKFASLPMLAQSTGCLNDTLAMLVPTIQLPVSDPYAYPIANKKFAATIVAPAVADFNNSGPLVSGTFNPIRAGKVSMKQLMLVDEFGRTRGVSLTNTRISTPLQSDVEQLTSGFVPPLRINQQTQMQFRWIAAADASVETSSIPYSSPICGWIVPNHLDGSIMFYDATGAGIGSLTGTDTSVQWQAAPGGAAPPTTPMADCFAGRNALLYELAQSISAGGAAHLAALVATFDRSQAAIAPANYAQNVGTAVLLGAPLAVVQAEIEQQIVGLPTPEQSYAALETDMKKRPKDRSTRNFQNVKFPVGLGSAQQLGDGLVGYFLQSPGDGGWTTNFDTLYALSADGSDNSIAVPSSTNILLSHSTDATSATNVARMTMLVDPRCSVRAANGIVPAQRLQVPPALAAYGMSRMVFTFLAAPLLELAGGFQIPVPAESNGDWSWVTYENGAWQQASLQSVNNEATLQTPAQLSEGWFQLTPKPRSTHDTTSD